MTEFKKQYFINPFIHNVAKKAKHTFKILRCEHDSSPTLI